MKKVLDCPLLAGIAMLAGCLLSGLSTVAQEHPQSSGTLRVGVSPVFPPMVFKQGGQLAGVEVDLARALGESLGRKVIFVELPWEDQIGALRADRTDIIMSSMSVTRARQQVMDFCRPYLLIGQLPLVRREDRHQYLLGLPPNPGTVGVLKATTGEFLVQREYPKAKRKVFRSEEDAVKALMKKKIDLFIGDSTLVWYLAGLHANDGVTVIPIPLSEEALAWGIRKGNDPLLGPADQFLQKATQDGTLNRIFRRWTAVSP
jgi:ABC-type amino acid transport substrate-binding protein